MFFQRISLDRAVYLDFTFKVSLLTVFPIHSLTSKERSKMKLSSYSPPPQAVSNLKTPATLSSKSVQRNGASLTIFQNQANEVFEKLGASAIEQDPNATFKMLNCAINESLPRLLMGALDGTPFSKLFEQAQKSNNLDE
jgi:hypothetical protein